MRIFAGNNTVPPVIWLVLLVGGVFAVSYTFFFGMKNIRRPIPHYHDTDRNGYVNFILGLCA